LASADLKKQRFLIWCAIGALEDHVVFWIHTISRELSKVFFICASNSLVIIEIFSIAKFTLVNILNIKNSLDRISMLCGELYGDKLLPITFRRQKFPTVIPFVINSVKKRIVDVFVLILLIKLILEANIFLKAYSVIVMSKHTRTSVNCVRDQSWIQNCRHTSTKESFEFLSIVVKIQTDFMTVLVIRFYKIPHANIS
jgi:hypothetical protein